MTDEAKTTAAVCTLEQLGYAYHGGEQWKPPLGKAPDFGLVNTLRDRISELQAELEAVGAGGVQALSAGPANDNRVPEAWTNLLAYVLQDDMHNRLTPRVIDIAYTAFNLAKQPSTEDGGASDWFNDTKPKITELIEKLRKDLIKNRAASPTPPAEQPADPMEWPLPCDITAGGVTIAKGCPLSTVQTRLAVQAEANAMLMRTHALRQVAPKAAPGEPTQEMIAAVQALVDLESSDPEDHRYDDGSKLAAQIFRAVLSAAPQQEAQELVKCSYWDSGYACCEDGPCKAEVHNDAIAAAPQAAPACLTCNDAGMIGGPSYSQPDEGGEPCPDCTISREQWIEDAARVYRIAGDTEEVAQECAAYLWGEQDMDDLADPYDAAMSDIEGRGPAPEQPAQPGAVYAELPDPDLFADCDSDGGFLGDTSDVRVLNTRMYREQSLRDFADRTHALRQAAPKAAPKDHELRELVNRLRDIAREFHGSQQLRERIAAEILPMRDSLAAPKAAPGEPGWWRKP